MRIVGTPSEEACSASESPAPCSLLPAPCSLLPAHQAVDQRKLDRLTREITASLLRRHGAIHLMAGRAQKFRDHFLNCTIVFYHQDTRHRQPSGIDRRTYVAVTGVITQAVIYIFPANAPAGVCVPRRLHSSWGAPASPPKKILASADPGSEIGARLGCRSAARVDPARQRRLRSDPMNLAGRARRRESAITAPHHCSVVSPENHHRRRRGDGAWHRMAPRAIRLPGHRV